MRLLVAAVLLAGALLAPAGPAQSHAVVLETVPADGAVLDRAPSAIVIRFSEPVTPIAGQVLDGEGRNVLPADAVSGSRRRASPGASGRAAGRQLCRELPRRIRQFAPDRRLARVHRSARLPGPRRT